MSADFTAGVGRRMQVDVKLSGHVASESGFVQLCAACRPVSDIAAVLCECNQDSTVERPSKSVRRLKARTKLS